MKVKFIKNYDDGTRVFQPGWVAEVGPYDGEALISDGFAVEVDSNVFSRMYAPTDNMSTECVVPESGNPALPRMTNPPPPPEQKK